MKKSIVVLAGMTLLASNAVVRSEDYPNRPVRLVVALAAGGSSDVIARIFAAKLSETLGQQVVIDNRPGAGGSVGGDIVSHAPADGYTLFFAANGTIAIAPNLLKLPFDVRTDLAPISMVGVSPFVMMIHPAIPAKSVQELIGYARANPNAINFGSSGQGSTGHLAWELVKAQTNTRMTHVPFKGAAPAMVSLVAGEIEAAMFGTSAAIGFIKRGQVRALGVTTSKRAAILPDVPAIAETIPGYDVASWYGFMAPRKTPPAIIERLHRATVSAMTSAEVKQKMSAAGAEADATTPEGLAAKMKEEIPRWGKLIRSLNLKAE